MSKSKHIIVKKDPNGDLHFEDGFFLPWSEIWEEAVHRSHWRQRGGDVYSKINNVIRDKHNRWKMDYPNGLTGGKVPSSNLTRGSWREWYNNRKALGLVPGIDEYGGKSRKKGHTGHHEPEDAHKHLEYSERVLRKLSKQQRDDLQDLKERQANRVENKEGGALRQAFSKFLQRNKCKCG